jgi:hypothetical protein
MLGKVINVDLFFFHFDPKQLGTLKKSWCLKNFGILRIFIMFNNYMCLKNAENTFDFGPKYFGIFENIFMLQKNWAI